MDINMTLRGQTITFVVFVWFCYKFIWPFLIAAMRERQKTIAEGLAAGEQAEQDVARAQAQVAERLTEAQSEAQRIVDQARSQATQMIDQAKQDARDEGERLKEAANAEIEQDINRARETLRGEVAALAVQGAERILGDSIDRERHGQLLNRLAAEL